MKNLISFLFSTLGLLFASSVSAADFMCTMEYAPVCAKVQVQCIRAPCYPVYETFSNSCVMSQNSMSSFAHEGECTTKETTVPAVLSDRLKASLLVQYKAFAQRISSLDAKAQIARLDIINARISDRLVALAINSLPLTLVEEMRIDKLKYALLFLQDLVETDISYLNDELAGSRYISKDAVQCQSIKFYCFTTETPFFGDKGCGCEK